MVWCCQASFLWIVLMLAPDLRDISLISWLRLDVDMGVSGVWGGGSDPLYRDEPGRAGPFRERARGASIAPERQWGGYPYAATHASNGVVVQCVWRKRGDGR